MVILSSDTVLVYPVTGGLGGPISNVRIPNNILNNVWPDITMAELEVGKTYYTLVYLYNDNKTMETLDNVRLFVYQPTISPYTDIGIALGQAPVNSSESEIANPESAPPGVANWTKGQSEDDSLAIGRLPPLSYKSVWLRLTVNVAPSGSSFPFDNYVLLSRHNPVAGPILPAGPGLPGLGGEPVPPPPGLPPPPPPSQIVDDPFGIRMIYNTSSAQDASSPFYIPATNPHLATRFDAGSGTVSANGDGSWRNSVISPSLRIYSAGEGGTVKTAAQAFANAADTYDHSDIASRGYWWKTNDWRAVEATGHFKINDAGTAAPGDAALKIFFRQLTPSSSVASGCGACYYGVYLNDDGRTGFNKSHYNIDPDPQPCNDNQFLPQPQFFTPRLAVNTGSLRSKFIGFKAIIWNFTFDGVPTGWTWYNPVTFDMPAVGDSVYLSWEIRYEQNKQYWYLAHRDDPIGEEVLWHGEFWNYANAVKYLQYIRNNILPSGPGVHLELWVDQNLSNTWVRQGVFDDGGNWLTGVAEHLTCPGGDRCGGALDQILTHGSPYVEFGFDEKYPAGGVYWKNLSVREISQPWITYQYTSVGTTSTGAPAPPPAPPSPPSPPPEPPAPPTPPPPPPPAGSGTDTFGVVKLFATKSAGDEWFSTAWANGTANNRFLGEGDTDPMDSRFMYSNGDPDTTELRIDGNSHAWQTEFNTSARIYVSGSWVNTEMTIFQRREATDTGNTTAGPGDGSGEDIQLRSRANHDKSFSGQTPNNCGFGNYLIKWETGAAHSAVEVEPLHPNYKRHLNEVNWTDGFPTEIWRGFKQITRTRASDSNVIVEGWTCTNIANAGLVSGWTKTTEFTFTGSNVDIVTTAPGDRIADCTGKGDNQISGGQLDAATRFLNAGLHCWIRANNFNNVRWKFFSVREIDPL